jgi:NDP-sugar pyrophosphorylase family protein
MTQIVVLAGGKATRLYPLTKEIPKSLVPINGVPFIEQQIQLFKKNDISEVVLCVGTFADKIREYVGDGSKFGISVKYSVEDDKNLLGTLGALKKAQSLLKDHFFVIWGDSYLETDYSGVLDAFLKSGKLGLMTAFKNQNKIEPSNMSISGNMVVEYDKRKNRDFEYVDYGLSVFKKTALDFFQEGQALDLSELNTRLISLNQLVAFIVHDRYYEVGSFQGIKELEDHLRAKIS